MDVTLTLDNDPERTVTVPLTPAGQGGATSADYSGVPASVTFNSGDTETTITFAATADDVDDDGESVKLTFGTFPSGVSAGTTSQAVVSITDDDVPSVTVSFEQATYTAAEGGSVTVKVKLSADPERTVTIPIEKTNQGGASNADYSGVPGNVTFNSGDTARDIPFAAAAASVDDDGESVRLGFGTLPDRVTAGTTSDTVVSITDDDIPAVTVNFQQATYTVNEGSSINITVTISPDPESTVRIPLTVTNQDGATDDDHSLVPGGHHVQCGEPEQGIHLPSGSGHRRRRRGERQDQLWFPSHRGNRRVHQRDGRLHHRRRRTIRHRQLRAGDLHCGRERRYVHHGCPGGQGHHQGQAQRRP